jgi:hypothetical protein
MPRRLRYGACVGVRGGDIAYPGMRASIGSPAHISILIRYSWLLVFSYSRATSHGSQQTTVDLNDLLDCLTCYPVSGCGSRVGGYDDTTLEAESEGGSSVGDLDGAVGIGVVVRHCAEP